MTHDQPKQNRNVGSNESTAGESTTTKKYIEGTSGGRMASNMTSKSVQIVTSMGEWEMQNQNEM